jgi:acylphosphatase
MKEVLVRQRVTATVHGVVQGVLFRQTARREAVRLGLVGTVRNQPDGTVRVVAEGDSQALKDLLRWLNRGPEWAVVERVNVEWQEPRNGLSGFRVES